MKKYLQKVILGLAVFFLTIIPIFGQVTIGGETPVASGQTHIKTLTADEAVTLISVVGTGTVLTINGNDFTLANSDTSGTIINGGTINGTGTLRTSSLTISNSGVINTAGLILTEVRTSNLVLGDNVRFVAVRAGSATEGNVTLGSGATDATIGVEGNSASDIFSGRLTGSGDDNLILRNASLSGTVTGFDTLTLETGGVFNATSGLPSGLATINLRGGRLDTGSIPITINNLTASTNSQIAIQFVGGNTTAQIALSNSISREQLRRISLRVTSFDVGNQPFPVNSENEPIKDVIISGLNGIAEGTKVNVEDITAGVLTQVLNAISAQARARTIILPEGRNPAELFAFLDVYGEVDGNGNLVFILAPLSARITDLRLDDILTGFTEDLTAFQNSLAELSTSGDLPRDLIGFMRDIADLEPLRAALALANAIPTSQVSTVTTAVTGVATGTNDMIGSRTAGVATRVTSGASGPDSEAKLQGGNFWVDYTYDFGGLDSDGSRRGYDFESSAIRIGFDKLYPNAVLGFAVNYTIADIDNEGTNARESEISTLALAFYGSQTLENSRVDYLLSYAQNDIDISGASKGSTQGTLLDVDVSYHYKSKDFTPYFGLRYIANDFDDYTLTGPLSMNIKGADYTSFFVELGTRWDYSYKTKDTTRNIGLKTSYSHNFSDTERNTTATFVGGTTPFDVRGVEEEEGIFNFGIDYTIVKGKTTYLFGYDVNINSIQNAHRFNIKLKREF